MEEHITDLVAFEWARFETTRLAPESPADVSRHLEACSNCREKLEAFRALEHSVHPYGSALPGPSRPRLLRGIILVAVVASILLLTILC